MQCIVIATTPESKWLPGLMRSMSGYDKYPILVLSDYTFELGKFRFVMEHTDIDEFVFLQDTVRVKNTDIFNLAFSIDKTVSFCVSPRPIGSYLGKYQRKTLKNLIIPPVTTKLESIEFENGFTSQIPDICTIPNPLQNTERFIKKLGRVNMVLENEYLIKYKSIWSRLQLKSL